MGELRVIRGRITYPEADWRVGAWAIIPYLAIVVVVSINAPAGVGGAIPVIAMPFALIFAWLANRRILFKPKEPPPVIEEVGEDTQARVNAAFERRRSSSDIK